MFSNKGESQMKKFFLENPIINLIMSIIPTVWFAFFAVFASEINFLMTEDKKLTLVSILINIIMLVIMFTFSIGMLIEKTNNKNIVIQKEKMYRSILGSVARSNVSVQNKLIENINNEDKGVKKSDYNSAISAIEWELLDCLNEITKIDKKDFVITYFFKPKGEENWASVSSDKGFKGIPKSTLASDEKSVMNQLLVKQSMLFYSSKERAAEKGKYIPDARDDMHKEFKNPMGSIFGMNWTINDASGSPVFENLIVVGTYGIEICGEKDIATKQKLIISVLETFSGLFLQCAIAYKIVS